MAGQDIPIPFFIKTIVTKSELSFSSSTLNFNNVYLNQNSILPITIKNGSFLPQKIGFVKVKKEIDIQPNDGFAILLPNESLEFSVNFCPSSITDYCFDLVLYTNNNDKFVIKVIGNGVRSPLLFDKYNLSLRTTSPGEKVIESITITNTHKHTICYEFVIPDLRYSWLKISPYIFELKSLQKCRVEIEFFPPENILNESAKEWFIKLKCDMINEGKEKENEKNDNNTKKNDSNDIVKIDIKNKNTDNINRSNNNDSNKNTINNNDDKNDVDNFNQSNNNDNESNDNLLLENIREPKTTFGVFTDFVEDSGLISVKNSFGQIQWLQNTELNLSNSIKSEMNDRLIVDNDSEKQNINNNELKNKKFNKIDNDNIVEISDTDLINNFKIENNSHNTITENIKNENKNDNNNNNIAINKRTKNKIDKAKNSKKKKEGIKEEITSNNISDVENENDSDLFGNQSVIYSSWSIPVFMKIIKNSENKKYENKTQILTKNLNTNKNMGKTNNNLDDEFIYSGDNIDKFRPLFFYLETVVSDPQISCDTKTVNFGQIAIGKKCLKSIKITNNTNNILQLVTYGTNAVGPFSILTPIKDLKPHEFRKIVIEFLPTETGSFTEILEYQNREEIGGHRIRISLRAYGVTPYITLTGLLPWGTSSKNGSGFLDFGNVLVNDTVLQNFTVLNQSLFDVDITLVRTSNGENSEKTISGLPLFSYRPESFLLLPGKIFAVSFYLFQSVFIVYVMFLLFLFSFYILSFLLSIFAYQFMNNSCSVNF